MAFTVSPPDLSAQSLQIVCALRLSSLPTNTCAQKRDWITPSSAGAAFLGYRISEPSCFLLGWIKIGSNLWDTPADERKAHRAAARGPPRRPPFPGTPAG